MTFKNFIYVKDVKLSFLIFDYLVKLYQVHKLGQSSGFNI